MPDISAAAVKRLRNETQSGMMDCKKALLENDGDLAAAKVWLRKKGLASAQGKAARATTEGMIALGIERRRAAIVEVNCETDFVARTDSFQEFLQRLAQVALETEARSLEALQTARLGEDSVEVALQELITKTGENIRLRRCGALRVQRGQIVSYVHARDREHVGKIGVLLALASNSSDAAIVAEEGKKLAMHIAAMRPRAIKRSDLPPALVEREREILHARAVASLPSSAPLEKVVAARMEKFFRSTVLEEQDYALDGSVRIADMLSALSERVGSQVAVESFLCFATGESVAEGSM